jgi:hypothetical protein
MIIALRFGSDSYASGDMSKAQKAFSDALTLYSELDNIRGMGIAQNNCKLMGGSRFSIDA